MNAEKSSRLIERYVVMLLGQLVAAVISHDEIVRIVRISISGSVTTLGILVVARNIIFAVRLDSTLLRSGVAQDMSMVNMRKLTSFVSTDTVARVFGAFEDVTLVTLLAGTITKARKGRADGS